MPKNEGLAVGGPLDGKYVSAAGRELRIVLSPPSSLDDPKSSVDLDTNPVFIRHSDYVLVWIIPEKDSPKIWLHESLTMGQALHKLVSAYGDKRKQ